MMIDEKYSEKTYKMELKTLLESVSEICYDLNVTISALHSINLNWLSLDFAQKRKGQNQKELDDIYQDAQLEQNPILSKATSTLIKVHKELLAEYEKLTEKYKEYYLS